MGQVTDRHAGSAGLSRRPAGSDSDRASAGDQTPAAGGAGTPASPGTGARAPRYLLAIAVALILVVAGAAIALHYARTLATVTVSGPPAGQKTATLPTQELARVAAAALAQRSHNCGNHIQRKR